MVTVVGPPPGPSPGPKPGDVSEVVRTSRPVARAEATPSMSGRPGGTWNPRGARTLSLPSTASAMVPDPPPPKISPYGLVSSGSGAWPVRLERTWSSRESSTAVPELASELATAT